MKEFPLPCLIEGIIIQSKFLSCVYRHQVIGKKVARETAKEMMNDACDGRFES